MDKEYLITDTALFKIIDVAVVKAVEQVKPVDCKLHAQRLTDFQDDLNGLATQMGTSIRNGKDSSDKLNLFFDKMFVSLDDDNLCWSEKTRQNHDAIVSVEKKIDNHVKYHEKVVSSWRFWVPVALTCISSIILATWALFKSMNESNINKEQIRNVITTVLEETK